MQPAVFYDRQTNFGENFLHVERACNRKGRCALTGKVAGLECEVREEVELLFPVLAAKHETYALGCPWRAKAVFAKCTRNVSRKHLLRYDTALEARRRKVSRRFRRRRRRARREDVPRHTVRISSVEGRATHDVAVSVFDDIKRTRDTRYREVVEIRFGKIGATVLIVGIVRPYGAEIAARTENSAVAGVLQVITTCAAFDVTTQDLSKRTVVRPARNWIDKIERRRLQNRLAQAAIGAGSVFGSNITNNGESITRKRADQQILIVADFSKLIGAEKRVVAVDRNRVAEVTGRSDLGDRTVVHEHELHVGLQRVGDFVVGEYAGRVTLVRTLVVVQRREVERRETAEQRTVRAKLPNCRRQRICNAVRLIAVRTATFNVRQIVEIVEVENGTLRRCSRTAASVRRRSTNRC